MQRASTLGTYVKHAPVTSPSIMLLSKKEKERWERKRLRKRWRCVSLTDCGRLGRGSSGDEFIRSGGYFTFRKRRDHATDPF